jgi:hypothetical protein
MAVRWRTCWPMASRMRCWSDSRAMGWPRSNDTHRYAADHRRLGGDHRSRSAGACRQAAGQMTHRQHAVLAHIGKGAPGLPRCLHPDSDSGRLGARSKSVQSGKMALATAGWTIPDEGRVARPYARQSPGLAHPIDFLGWPLSPSGRGFKRASGLPMSVLRWCPGR